MCQAAQPPAHAVLRGYFLCLAVAYTVIVSAASLTPWKPAWPDAATWQLLVDRFPWVGVDTPSVLDGLANVALFVPLGFLWSAAILSSNSWGAKFVRSLAVVGLSALASSSIEWAQLAFPGRIVSHYDVLAETLGAVGGVGLWWACGSPCRAWLAARQKRDPAPYWQEWALQIYACALVLCWLLPLDLTIRPTELLGKYRAGLIVIDPLHPLSAARLGSAVQGAALFFPVGFWLATTATPWPRQVRSQLASYALLLAMLGLLSGMQLLVMSRRTDIVEWIGVAGGMICGVWLARWRYGGSPAANG
jgi:glycopeptide antibiotics resistance protein